MATLNPTLIVTETELPSINIASIRFQGQYHEIGIYFEKLYRIVQNKTDGLPITCYHSLEFCEIADIEVCVPVSKKKLNLPKLLQEKYLVAEPYT